MSTHTHSLTHTEGGEGVRRTECVSVLCSAPQTKMLEEAHVGPEDFATMRLLGRGGFGTVYACRKIDSGKLYAMKAIHKKLIKGKKAVAMTMLERHTLSLVQSRFVCTLAYAFQDKTHLFLMYVPDRTEQCRAFPSRLLRRFSPADHCFGSRVLFALHCTVRVWCVGGSVRVCGSVRMCGACACGAYRVFLCVCVVRIVCSYAYVWFYAYVWCVCVGRRSNFSMDLMAGGDLKFHLTKNRSGAPGFSEAR